MRYWDSFGYEWSRWPQLQLDGPDQGESERTFQQKTGLTPEDVKGKRVLDVGCGAGRFLEVVARWGARSVVGIEPSEAYRIARQNVPRARIIPVPIEQFLDGAVYDIVYCLGVLHHTPDPTDAFQRIARLVRPGGILCVWVYTKSMERWCVVSDCYRRVTVHLPWTLLRVLCLLAVPWGLLPSVPIIGRSLFALWPCSTHPNWRWRWLDTFDWYAPRYQSKHTVSEVTHWFSRAGFTDIQALDFPVSVRGRRP